MSRRVEASLVITSFRIAAIDLRLANHCRRILVSSRVAAIGKVERVQLIQNPQTARASSLNPNASSNTVSVIRAATNTVAGMPITVGVQPIGVAITPDGTQAYVTNFHDGTVSVIDTATKMVVATVLAGSGAEAVAFTPDGTRVYVANFHDGTVSVFARSGNTNTPVASIQVEIHPSYIAITPDGTPLFR